MRKSSVIHVAALSGALALLAPSTIAFAQEVTNIAGMLSGKSIATSYKPEDLPPDYRPVKLKAPGGSDGSFVDMMTTMYSPLSMGSGGMNSQYFAAMLMAIMDLSWTKGDVVKMEGKDFLVTYKLDRDMSQVVIQEQPSDQPDLKQKFLSGMRMSLVLVATNDLVSISPVTNYSKDDLLKLVQSKGPEQDTRTLQSQSLAKAKQIALALNMYVTDYDDVLPCAQSTKAVQYVTFPYCKNADVWKTLNPQQSEFLYNTSIGGANMSDIPSPAGTVLFYESVTWSDGRRVVAFLDGHAKILGPEEWSGVVGTLRTKVKKVAKPLPMKYGMDWSPGK